MQLCPSVHPQESVRIFSRYAAAAWLLPLDKRELVAALAAMLAACLMRVLLVLLTVVLLVLLPEPVTPLVLDDDELPEPVTPATDEPPVAVLVDPLVAVVSPTLPPVPP